MNKRKVIVVLITIIIISTLLSACAPKMIEERNYAQNSALTQINMEENNDKEEEHYNVSLIDDYRVYYGRDYGSFCQQRGVMSLREVEHTIKSLPDINYTFFGKEYNLMYEETKTTKINNDGKDEYLFIGDGEYYKISLNGKTGKIIFFYDSSSGRNHEYVSPVKPSSSESEFIAYASSILSEYMNISTEGWNVEIITERHESDWHWGLLDRVDRFANVKVDPDIDVVYTISFYRYLNDKCEGIRRADTVYVKMTSFGEVVEFSGEVFDDKYIPYADTELDVEKIKDVFKYESDFLDDRDMVFRAISYNDELWIEMEIRNTSESKKLYTMKVAEIIPE